MQIKGRRRRVLSNLKPSRVWTCWFFFGLDNHQGTFWDESTIWSAACECHYRPPVNHFRREPFSTDWRIRHVDSGVQYTIHQRQRPGGGLHETPRLTTTQQCSRCAQPYLVASQIYSGAAVGRSQGEAVESLTIRKWGQNKRAIRKTGEIPSLDRTCSKGCCQHAAMRGVGMVWCLVASSGMRAYLSTVEFI